MPEYDWFGEEAEECEWEEEPEQYPEEYKFQVGDSVRIASHVFEEPSGYLRPGGSQYKKWQELGVDLYQTFTISGIDSGEPEFPYKIVMVSDARPPETDVFGEHELEFAPGQLKLPFNRNKIPHT